MEEPQRPNPGPASPQSSRIPNSNIRAIYVEAPHTPLESPAHRSRPEEPATLPRPGRADAEQPPAGRRAQLPAATRTGCLESLRGRAWLAGARGPAHHRSRRDVARQDRRERTCNDDCNAGGLQGHPRQPRGHADGPVSDLRAQGRAGGQSFRCLQRRACRLIFR